MLMIPALGIFAVTYFLVSQPRWPFAQLDRPTAGLIGAVLMIAAGLLTPEQAYQAIDWDTIVLLLGMSVLSGSLRLAGFFEWAGEVVLAHVRTPTALLKALVFVSGLLSALLVVDADR
jgi:Na+/H+ antiporter NhaD/arsenite permease-like protein